MADYKIYSADSHVSEPGDLWVERIDAEYRFRAPRLDAPRAQREDRRPVDLRRMAATPRGASAWAPPTATDPANFPVSARKARATAMLGRGAGTRPTPEGQDVDGVVRGPLHHPGLPPVLDRRTRSCSGECFRVYNDWLGGVLLLRPQPTERDWLSSPFMTWTGPLEELGRAAKKGHQRWP